jgi:MFS family permease
LECRKLLPGRLIERHPFFFGWKVAWVAFTIAMFSWGIGFYGPSVFLQTLHATRGWSISSISAAITTHFLSSAAMVAYLPEVHQRFGLAWSTLAGIGLSALGAMAWANAQYPWQLFLAALVSSAGWAATSGAAINAMVAPWFDRDRPKALSIAYNGASVGGVVFAPLWVTLIAQLGFPTTALVIGIATAALLSPLALRFLSAALQDLGLQPDGVQQAHAGQSAVKPTLSRRHLLGDRRFLTISGAFALGLFAQIGLFAHLITRLAPALGESGAALALSLTTVCAVLGRTLLGWLLGERDRHLAASVNFAVQAGGVVLLDLGSGVAVLLLGCILFGLGVGNLISLPPIIAQKEFERGDVPTVVALITAINQAVFAFAPAIFGALRDLTGEYAMPFAIAACLQFAAAFIVLAGRRR